jgi:hypothetical protein
MKLQVDFGEHTHESFPRVFRYKVKLLWEIEEKEKGSSWANQYLYHGAHHRCSRLVAGEDLSFPRQILRHKPLRFPTQRKKTSQFLD